MGLCLFSRILLLKVGIFILKISKMIPKTAIVILATLLVAIEAQSSREVIGERLKGFHDHFTSQANVIKDAGINTEKIMNSLSTQLKSLLQDAIKEMDNLDKDVADLLKENTNLTNENNKLKKESEDAKQICHDTLEDIYDQLKELNGQVDKLNVEKDDLKNKLKECEEEKDKVTKVCYDALTDCKNKIIDIGNGCQKDCEAKLKPLQGQVDKLNVEKNNLQTKLKKCVADKEDELKKQKE